MITVNLHQAKTNLSHYLKLVEQGKTIIVSRRNVPIAKLTPITTPSPKRQLGGLKNQLTIPKSFFDELPPAIITGFNPTK